MAKKTKTTKISKENPYKDYAESVKAKIKLISPMYKQLRDIVFSRENIFYAQQPFSSSEIDFIKEYYKTFTDEEKAPEGLSKELNLAQNCRINMRLEHIRKIASSFENSYMDEEYALYLISQHLVIMLTELRFK